MVTYYTIWPTSIQQRQCGKQARAGLADFARCTVF